ncbi:hypothetical protein ACIF8Z_04870 [Pseudomonas promysalinigenes]|uniref:hypothetical protein n=1 Tax=Pseudomonas promysalinigenes TaxID=485898 RepID=UPI0037C83AEA
MKNFLSIKHFYLSLILQVSMQGGAWGEGNDFEGWVGEYSQESSLCTDPGGGRDCRDEFRDTLVIVKESKGYRVELNSTQSMQHICSFVLTMEPDAERLIYKSELGVVSIERRDNVLKVSSGGIDSTTLGLGFCGAHADIDGLEFSFLSRVR